MIDERGDLAAANVPFQSVRLADRAHFRAHLGNGEVGLFAGEPILGRLSGRWSIPLSRRINKPDGAFGGVVGILINPHYFVEFYERLNLGRDGVVSLVGLDQIVRAGSKKGRPASRATITNPALWPALDGTSEGTFVARDDSDGVRRLYSCRRLKDFPLVVLIGTAEREKRISRQYEP